MSRKDPYLDKLSCITRLVKEWEIHKSLVIAYEFDNTVAHPSNDEQFAYPVLIDALREAEALGLHLLVFTGRQEDQINNVVTYLNTNRIPFHYVNKSPEYIKFESQKPFYNLLLDSRAGLAEGLSHLQGVIAHIRSVKSTRYAQQEM